MHKALVFIEPDVIVGFDAKPRLVGGLLPELERLDARAERGLENEAYASFSAFFGGFSSWISGFGGSILEPNHE
jgi:hypothetical protein